MQGASSRWAELLGGEQQLRERLRKSGEGVGEPASHLPPDSGFLLLQILGQDVLPSAARVEWGRQSCPRGEPAARTEPEPPLVCGSVEVDGESVGSHTVS